VLLPDDDEMRRSSTPGGDPDEVVQVGDSVEIGNEFSLVRIRKVLTRNGERLEIVSAKLGSGIRLDAIELESISWQPHETFTRFLETPFGPESA
jgi:hypothetical protein